MTERSAAPNRPLGPIPGRRTHSIRRTSTLDTDWPKGREGAMRVLGRARDLLTGASLEMGTVVAEQSIQATVSTRREILAITSDPPRPTLDRLIGVRAGGHLRGALEDSVPDDKRCATPLYLLLDDLAGASLVANWIWSRWDLDWEEYVRKRTRESSENGKGKALKAGVCTGFAPGSSALNSDGTPNTSLHNYAIVPEVRNPNDAAGWHAFETRLGVAVQRARSMEVWIDDVVHADIYFQDSGTLPDGGRAAVHEYRVMATIDRESLQLRTLSADPRVLPFMECPAATLNIAWLIGLPVENFRRSVIDTLPGTLGCTHLNDVLRSLADIPNLVEALQTTPMRRGV